MTVVTRAEAKVEMRVVVKAGMATKVTTGMKAVMRAEAD